MQNQAKIILTIAVFFSVLIPFTTGALQIILVALAFLFYVGLYIFYASTGEVDENENPVPQQKKTNKSITIKPSEKWANN